MKPWCCHIVFWLKTERNMQAWIVPFANSCMLHIGTNSVIALLANFPTDAVPHLVQVFYLGSEHFFGIAPNTQGTHTFVNG